MNLEGQSKTFDFKTNKPLKNDEVMSKKLKAYIQFYRNGLIENSWIK